MTMKQNSIPSNAAVCGQCGVEERKFIHNVRLSGNFRRLCTTCVLRLHPRNFCPTCLTVYHRSPPEDAVVCFKCYSYSHPNCVTLPTAGSISSSRGPSPCLSCLNPNLLKLNLSTVENAGRISSRVIDHKSARLLLAAGEIASISMNKAELAAAQEAERRSKDAANTKKGARDALDHLVRLMEKEKIYKVTESGKKVFRVNNGVAAKPYAVVNNPKSDPSSGRQVQGVSVDSVVSKLQGNGVVGIKVDVGHGNDLGTAENGSVKSDDLMKVVAGGNICNGHEQALEKVTAMEENSVVNPTH